MGILEKIFIPKVVKNEFTNERFLKDLRKGKFRDNFNLGISEQKGGSWLLKNFEKEPNALFVGQMGSGKSMAAKFTLFTWLLANSDHTRVFIVDILKGAQDYKVFFDLPQVELVDTPEGVHRVLDLAHEEMIERQKMFNKEGANALSTYEKATGAKMDRVVILFEEFHAVSSEINFEKDYKKEGSSAYKYWQLMKVGRSMGLWSIACSQKSTKADLPPEIVDNYTQKQIFKVSKAESMYVLSKPDAARLSSERPGRCLTDTGQVQFPYIEDSSIIKALKEFAKENTAYSAYLKSEIIKDYLEGRSSEAIYRHKKFVDLVKQIDNLDEEVVIRMFHKAGGCEIETRDASIDRFNIAQIATFRDGRRSAVMIKTKIQKLQDKHIKQLMKGVVRHKCDNGILYTTAKSISEKLRKTAYENNIELVDLEDLVERAIRIDFAKESGEEEVLDSDKIASDEKEQNSLSYEEGDEEDNEYGDEKDYSEEDNSDYLDERDEEEIERESQQEREKPQGERLNNNFIDNFVDNIDKDDDEEEEAKEDKEKNNDYNISDIFDTSEDISLNDLITIKRPALNRDMKKLRPEDNPTLMVHCLRNESGEVYRVLFYTILRNELYHKYFVDKKVDSKFDFVEKKRLGISDIDDWNNNTLVLSEKDFQIEIENFLNNFNRVENPVFIVCWNKDLSFLKDHVLNYSLNISDSPTILEETFFEIFRVDQTREDLIEDLQIKSKPGDKFFEEIDKDYQLWKNVAP